jgi:DNA-3-methyladenine glycosylase II
VPAVTPPTSLLRLDFARQINFAESLAFLGRAGDDVLDRFDGRTLLRTIPEGTDSPPQPFAIDVPQSPTDKLDARLPVGADDAAATAIAETFIVSTKAIDELALRDAAIDALVRRHSHFVPVLFRDPFTALIRSISAQQINLRFAAVLRQRLALRYGHRLEIGDDWVYALDREALASASVEDLRALQFTYAKARAVVGTARAATAGELRSDDLARMSDDQVVAHLTRLPGIGRWSAEWFLARTLGRPCVVAGDLAVRKAVGRLYGVSSPTEIETRRLTEHWGAAATVAQALALHDWAISPGETPAR